MQWISLLLSFLIGKFNINHNPSLSFKESIHLLFDEIEYRSRMPTIMILGGLLCVIFLCGGFFMSLIDFTTQFDRDGAIHASASNISGIVIALIAIGIFTWIFKRAWPGVKPKESQPAVTPNPSGLEQALTLLVMDYIKEREFKREQRQHPQSHGESQKEEPSPLYNN